MNVVNLNIEFDYFTFLLIYKSSNATLNLVCYFPYKDSNRYFATKTMCYWQHHIVCDNLRQRLIATPHVALWGQLNLGYSNDVFVRQSL